MGQSAPEEDGMHDTNSDKTIRINITPVFCILIVYYSWEIMFLVKFVFLTNYIKPIIITYPDDRKMAKGKEKGALLQAG
jgi:hypothetical protein